MSQVEPDVSQVPGSSITVVSNAFLDNLETYLLNAPVLTAHRGSHGAHPSYRVALEGGVTVIAKPEDEVGEGPLWVRKEAAAWKVARGLGWPDMMSATVLREMPSFNSGGGSVSVSLQVIWPDPIENVPLSELRDEEVWRGAVFDTLTLATDRSHNWLGIKPGPPYRLVLIDHGHAFAESGAAVGSAFYQAKQGHELPEACLQALARYALTRTHDNLSPLLPPERIAELELRLDHLLSTRALTLPGP